MDSELHSNNFRTFFGGLYPQCGDFAASDSSANSENCYKCLAKDIEIEFLKKHVALLDDIIKTSDLITECNQSLTSSKPQSHSVETSTQTECTNNSEEVQYDIITVTPKSFMLTDERGNIELPKSLLSVRDQEDSLESEPIHGKSPESSWGTGLQHHPALVSTPVSTTPQYEQVTLIETVCNSDSADRTPVTILNDRPFSNFSMEQLLAELNFDHKFKNRQAVYFGNFGYQYGGATHNPKQVPQDSHLAKIWSYLSIVLPDVSYNSALINYYATGEDHIPAHADSEACIEEESDIVTVSLGSSRTLQITSCQSGAVVEKVELHHGDTFVMSKSSQSHFRHEILPCPTSSEPRVSITFRQIKPPPRITQRTEFGFCLPPGKNDHQEIGFVPFYHHKESDNQTSSCQQTTGKEALFISSSMFRFLDPEKLSSPAIKATKLFYPGADARVMLAKLKVDLNSITSPSNVYLMTGTNNVNPIYYGSRSLAQAKDDINSLITFLKSQFPAAVIHVVNILPRASKGRNDVVRELNLLIGNICANDKQLDFIETAHLFKYREGNRKQHFFVPASDKVGDNCHLNKLGVIRLAKFLKYWAHQHIS